MVVVRISKIDTVVNTLARFLFDVLMVVVEDDRTEGSEFAISSIHMHYCVLQLRTKYVVGCVEVFFSFCLAFTAVVRVGYLGT